MEPSEKFYFSRSQQPKADCRQEPNLSKYYSEYR